MLTITSQTLNYNVISKGNSAVRKLKKLPVKKVPVQTLKEPPVRVAGSNNEISVSQKLSKSLNRLWEKFIFGD